MERILLNVTQHFAATISACVLMYYEYLSQDRETIRVLIP